MFYCALIGWLLGCTAGSNVENQQSNSGFTPIAFGLTELWLNVEQPDSPRVTLPSGELSTIDIQIFGADFARSMEPQYSCELIGSISSFRLEVPMPWMGMGTIKQESGTCEEKGVELSIDGFQFFVENRELFDSQITNLQRFFSDNGQDWEEYAPYAVGVFVDMFRSEPGPFQEGTWGIRYEVDSTGTLKTDQNGNLIPLLSQDFSSQGAVRILGLAPFDISVF